MAGANWGPWTDPGLVGWDGQLEGSGVVVFSIESLGQRNHDINPGWRMAIEWGCPLPRVQSGELLSLAAPRKSMQHYVSGRMLRRWNGLGSIERGGPLAHGLEVIRELRLSQLTLQDPSRDISGYGYLVHV